MTDSTATPPGPPPRHLTVVPVEPEPTSPAPTRAPPPAPARGVAPRGGRGATTQPPRSRHKPATSRQAPATTPPRARQVPPRPPVTATRAATAARGAPAAPATPAAGKVASTAARRWRAAWRQARPDTPPRAVARAARRGPLYPPDRLGVQAWDPYGWSWVQMPRATWREAWRTWHPLEWLPRLAIPAATLAATLVVAAAITSATRTATPATWAAIVAATLAAIPATTAVAWWAAGSRHAMWPSEVRVAPDGAPAVVHEPAPHATWRGSPVAAVAGAAAAAAVFVAPAGPLGELTPWLAATATALAGWKAWTETSVHRELRRESDRRAFAGTLGYAPPETKHGLDVQAVIDTWYSTVAPPKPTRSEMQAARAEGRDLPATTKLSGSKIVAGDVVMRDDGGFTAVVQLPTSDDSGPSLLTSRARLIAKAYGTSAGYVAAGPYRAGGESYADLVVAMSDPLAAVTEWGEPSLDPTDGTCAVGVDALGREVRWRLWLTGGDGGASTLVVGAKRSGKSGWWGTLLLEAALSGVCWTMLVDPTKRGASHPALAGSGLLGRVASSEADAIATVRATRAAAEWRAEHGMVGRDPSPEFPLLLLVLPEAGRTLALPGVLDDVSWLASVGPAMGVHVALDHQQATKAALGDDEYVRSQALSGNVVGTYLPDRGGAGVLTPLRDIDLSSIGEGRQGVGYVRGVGDTGPRLARALWVSPSSIDAARAAAGRTGARLGLADWAGSGGDAWAAQLD